MHLFRVGDRFGDRFGDVVLTPISPRVPASGHPGQNRIGCTTLKHQKLNDASPPSPRQGGASGLEQDGDYIENKIARGIYGAFGAVAHTAADEAKLANKAAKDAANKAARQARDSVKHVKDAARDAAKTAR